MGCRASGRFVSRGALPRAEHLAGGRKLRLMYVELHARSAFSFLRGAALPEELAQSCATLQMPAMALLDTDGVYGAPRFHLAAQKLGVKAHIGAELPLQIDAATP